MGGAVAVGGPGKRGAELHPAAAPAHWLTVSFLIGSSFMRKILFSLIFALFKKKRRENLPETVHFFRLFFSLFLDVVRAAADDLIGFENNNAGGGGGGCSIPFNKLRLIELLTGRLSSSLSQGLAPRLDIHSSSSR